jgi:hypothetical protein
VDVGRTGLCVVKKALATSHRVVQKRLGMGIRARVDSLEVHVLVLKV